MKRIAIIITFLICCNGSFCMNNYDVNRCGSVLYKNEANVDLWIGIVNSKAFNLLISLENHVECMGLNSVQSTIFCALDLYNEKECPAYCANVIFLASLMELRLIEDFSQICEIPDFLKDCIKQKDVSDKLDLDALEMAFFYGVTDKKVESNVSEKLKMLEMAYFHHAFGFFMLVKSIFRDKYDEPEGLYQQALSKMEKLASWMSNVG